MCHQRMVLQIGVNLIKLNIMNSGDLNVKDRRIFVGGGICLLLSSVGLAGDKPACAPSDYKTFVQCAVQASGDVQIAESQLKSASELEGIARQWSNPDFDAESVKKGAEKGETTLSLMFNIRLGGKRSAEIDEALGELEKARANRDLSVNRARLDLMLALYRLSHIRNEASVEEESIDTFGKIVSQFQKKPALAPEQEVSLSVFRMAVSDHQLRLTKLRSEEEAIYQSITASTGIAKNVIQKSLPARKSVWPLLSEKQSGAEAPQARLAYGELKLAKAQKDKADAAAWPDLKIGPVLKMQKEGSTTDQLFGIGLSIPLPIFTFNGAAKNYGGIRLVEAEFGYDLAKRKSEALQASLIKKYSDTVAALKNALSSKSLEEKHERLERLFFRGVVPSSLVIEAHRQLFELEEKRNEAEREAVEALGMYYILNNSFSEVIL